jgi:hypothetical protein
LRNETTGITYEGKVEDRAFVAVHSATLDEQYDVVIIETSILDEVVGDTKTTYTLAQLAPVE